MANRPTLNLNLTKKAGLMLAGILAVAIPVILGLTNAPELRAQAEPVPKFEVASVRPSPPLQLPLVAPIRVGMFLDAGRVEFKLMSLRDLILIAYRIKQYQLTGGPDWLAVNVFDIQATIPQGAAATGTAEMHCASDERPCHVSATKVPEMLQALLAERFGLRIRRENREMPVYALTVARGGPKFRERCLQPILRPSLITRRRRKAGLSPGLEGSTTQRPFASGQPAAAETAGRYSMAVATLHPNRCTWKYPRRQWCSSQAG